MESALQWLCPQEIRLDIDLRDRRDALRAVSVMTARAKRLAAPPIYRALWRREMAGSTAVGNGLAIPHARISNIVEPVTVYMRTHAPLNFVAPDGKWVSEFYVILVPAEGAREEHLQLLACVAEAFADDGFRARLAASTTPREVRSVFSRWMEERQRSATAERLAFPN